MRGVAASGRVGRGVEPLDPLGTEAERPLYQPRRKRALLVGIDLAAGGRGPLGKAVADAKSLALLLREEFGFETTLLLDAEATRGAIEAGVTAGLDVADEPTQWLFFFAGHGHVDGEQRGFLLPADAAERDLKVLVSVDDLVTHAIGGSPSEVLLLLDTCYSGSALLKPERLDDRLPREMRRREHVRQVVAASSPSRPAYELEGSTHSIFTSCLLDALAGWMPVHEPEGSVRFEKLREFLTEEVGRRLPAHLPPEQRQQVVGGNLVGTARPFGVELRPVAPRIPPGTLEDLAGDHEELRIRALEALLEDCRSDTRRLAKALALVLRHLPRRSMGSLRRSGPPHLGHEPGPAERRAAVEALGDLARLARSLRGQLPQAGRVERLAGRELLAQALGDPAPEVRHGARQGLGVLSPKVAARSAARLAIRYHSGDRLLRRHAWDALTAFSAGRRAVPLALWWRIPLTLARIEADQGARLFWASGARRRATFAAAAVVASFYLAMASTYHIDLTEATFLVRSGLPAFGFAPGVGTPLVDTGIASFDLQPAGGASREDLVGLWPWHERGVQLWGRQLGSRLKPVPAALALWRLGDSEEAARRLLAGIEAGETEAVAVAAYLAMQSPASEPWLPLLTPLLSSETELQGPARQALRSLAEIHPQAVSKALGGDISLFDEPTPPAPAAPTAEQAALLVSRLETGGLADRVAAVAALLAAPPELLPQARLAAGLGELLEQEMSQEGRSQVLQLLGRLGEPAAAPLVLAALERAARDRSPFVRVEAVELAADRALVGSWPAAAIEPLLATALEDRDAFVQAEAAMGVGLLGDQLPDLVPRAVEPLFQILIGDDLLAQRLATSLPERLRRAPPAACRCLLENLAPWLAKNGNGRDWHLREFLRSLGSAAPQCTPGLAALAAQLLAVEPDGASTTADGLETLWALSQLALSNRRLALEEQLLGLAADLAPSRAAAATAVGYLAARDPVDAARALEALRPLLADPEVRVRAAAVGALWVLGEVQSSLVPRVAPALAPALRDENSAVREAVARAFQRLDPDRDSVPLVVSRLAVALPDPSPVARRELAASLGRWGAASPTLRSFAAQAVERRLSVETEPTVVLSFAAALGLLAGEEPAVRERVLSLAKSGLAGDKTERELAVEALEILGQSHPDAIPEALALLSRELRRDPGGDSVRALHAVSQIGLSQPQGGALALDLIEPLLLDRSWPLRRHALLNVPLPICQQHRELAPRGIRLLRKVVDQEDRSGRSAYFRLALDALIEIGTLRALGEPDSIWPLLWSPRSGERAAGLEVLAALADQRPELVPSLRKRLARLRRWPQPHVRIAAAQGEEMIVVLERTRWALEAPASYPRWQATLEGLPEVGIRPAVRRALDRLEPSARHQ